MIYVFSVIKGILVNIGDSTFSFATSQDPLVSKLTFKTTLEQKELSSNWCFKTLPTPAGTDLSPRFRDIRLIVCVGTHTTGLLSRFLRSALMWFVLDIVHCPHEQLYQLWLSHTWVLLKCASFRPTHVGSDIGEIWSKGRCAPLWNLN